ncbi:RIP metalloprotease RseP [Solirhodobacter olei]|uniref:RIP metalloprotease RseP n=1 Tax=Solirhodobacter olei TaxID=2493082 RepID=UPI000FD9A3E6|nr:RIP metalloprotease RseP [Solirhodobacter olei]
MDVISQVPSFGGMVYTAAAFVVALSIIVAVHEYGHYIVGRWSGIHAEVFSLGFGPVLFSRIDRRGTRWQVSALPFGGYVRFLGDSDAASGRDEHAMEGLSEDQRRHSMHGAPLWARAATVVAGPAFNLIFSIFLLVILAYAQGVPTAPVTVGKLKPAPAATADALRPGDQILAIDGKATPNTESFYSTAGSLVSEPSVSYKIRRDGQEMTVTGPNPMPARAEAVAPQSAAYAAGIKAGDVFTAVDGKPISTFEELRKDVVNGGGAPLKLTVWRDGKTLSVTLKPRRSDLPTTGGAFQTRWLIGVSGGLFFSPDTRLPGPFEALGMAVSQTRYVIFTSLSGLWHMVTGAISACNLHGPLGIAETSGAAASQGALTFLSFIAMLSTAVGLLNLFPVPVLDGGHLVFHAWEAVAGRPPSDRALRLLMGGGLFAILALMAFALSNDVFCP